MPWHVAAVTRRYRDGAQTEVRADPGRVVFEWSQPARGGGAGGSLSLPKTTGAIQQRGTRLAPSKSMEIYALGEPRVFQCTLGSFSGGGRVGRCCPGRKRRSGRSPLGQPSPGSAPPKGSA